MSRPALEVADIFRQHGEAYRRQHPLPRHQLRLMRAIEIRRTATLGGHIKQCDTCHRKRNCYNSCRNRHCPKCGSLARARRLHRRQAELLPVPYFHVVFTLPAAEFIRRDKLALLARLLKHPVTELLPLPKDCAALLALPANRHKDLCPHCGVGHLHCIAVLLPIRWQAPVIDSS